VRIVFDVDAFDSRDLSSEAARMCQLRSAMLERMIDFNRASLRTWKGDRSLPSGGLPPVREWNVEMDDWHAREEIYDAVLLIHRGYGSVESIAAALVAEERNAGRYADVRYVASKREDGGIFITCEVWVDGKLDEWFESKRRERS